MRDTIVDDPSGCPTRSGSSTTRSSTPPSWTRRATRCCASPPSRSSPCCRRTSAGSTLGPGFPTHVNDDHREILEAIEAGDVELAAERMHAHMAYLREIYVGIWHDPKT
jgi:hypothetical protein